MSSSRLSGFLSIASIILEDGRVLSARDARKAGLLEVPDVDTDNWPHLDIGELPIGTNVHTDGGRQYMIYCWGGRSPVTDFITSQFGIGTGTTPETVGDLSLEAPLTFYDSNADSVPDSTLKPVNSIDYPEPFIARASITIAASEAQGILITEMGLFSGNGTLVNRSLLDAPINKGSLAKNFLYRVRF